MGRIYLAGPITGCNFKTAALSWRKEVADALEADGIKVYSPMRGTPEIKRGGKYPAMANHSGSPFDSTNGILHRDYYDVRKADLIFACLLNAPRVSIGTVCEYGWASAHNVPILTVMEPEGNFHEHLFIKGLSAYVVPSIAEGIEIAKLFFKSGV